MSGIVPSPAWGTLQSMSLAAQTGGAEALDIGSSRAGTAQRAAPTFVISSEAEGSHLSRLIIANRPTPLVSMDVTNAYWRNSGVRVQ
jgi:hypothetical protein